MDKFVIDIKADKGRLLIVDRRTGIDLYEIEVNDGDTCEADRLIDAIDEGISLVLQYREDNAQEPASPVEEDAPTSLTYLREVSKVFDTYNTVLNTPQDLLMKGIIDLAIRNNLDNPLIANSVYDYVEARKRALTNSIMDRFMTDFKATFSH